MGRASNMHHEIKASKPARKQANRSSTHTGVFGKANKKRKRMEEKTPNTKPPG